MIALILGCAGPTALPAPTGDAAVGETLRHYVDADRDEVITPGDDRREVTVRVWYPAVSEGTEAAYVPDLDELAPALNHRTERLFRHVLTHAVLDASALEGPFPVVVLSHGDDRITAEYTFLAEELASHGYVVAGVDHAYDARAVRLANGEAVAYAEDAWPDLPPAPADGVPDPDTDYARYYRARVEVRAADARFVLDQLAADAELGPRVNPGRVAFVGHSVGGVAAGTFCQTDPRALACVNLNGDSGLGPFYLTDDGRAFDPPYLMLTKPFEVTDDQLVQWGLTREEWAANLQARRDAMFGAVTGGSWLVELDGATHESFGDEPYVVAMLTGEDASADEAYLAVVRAWTLAFLDRFLGGPASSLLDDPPQDGVTVQRWAAR